MVFANNSIPGVTDSESGATESSVLMVMWGKGRPFAYGKVLVLQFLIASTCLGALCFAAAIDNGEQQKSFLPPHWWESASALRNVSLKDDTPYPQVSLDPAKAESQMQAIKKQGFAGIQVFGPADGGKSYNGLDTRDHFRIEPKYGTVDDFAHLVRVAHSSLSRAVFERRGRIRNPNFSRSNRTYGQYFETEEPGISMRPDARKGNPGPLEGRRRPAINRPL